jgi:hypothetical protein
MSIGMEPLSPTMLGTPPPLGPTLSTVGDPTSVHPRQSSVDMSVGYKSQREADSAVDTIGTSAAAGGGGGLQPQDLIRGLLQDLGDSVGIVHLALHCASSAPSGPGSRSGLVLQWARDMLAVVEPGVPLCAGGQRSVQV